MKISDLAIGQKYLYQSFNPYDNTYMEIAYEYLGCTSTKLYIFRYLNVNSNIPGLDLLKFDKLLVELDTEFLTHDLRMGWSILPENYELVYSR